MKKKILFSESGKQEIMEKLKCNKDKIEKIVRKAFISKGDNIPQTLHTKKDYNKNNHYKYYLGYIFVFSDTTDGVLFVTLYNPKESLQKNKK